MNWRTFAACVALLFGVGCSGASAPGAGEHPDAGTGDSDESGVVHWSYGGDTGPENWASLSPDFATCASGRNQSPIDLFPIAEGRIVSGGLDQRYQSTTLSIRSNALVEDILDNGHTIQIDQPGASFIDLNGLQLQLVQFHFHAPSEHTIEGRRFPLEMHFVHSSADGVLGVVGILVEEGAAHAELAKVVANLPDEGETLDMPGVTIDPAGFGSRENARDRFRYSGSLTTPPCSEGVRWVVARDPIQASAEQIEAIATRMPTNNRPIQPLNGRMILRVMDGG